ncbi:hypothetical protein NDU88_000490, partial [Pleurodeles waltl]
WCRCAETVVHQQHFLHAVWGKRYLPQVCRNSGAPGALLACSVGEALSAAGVQKQWCRCAETV